MTGFTGEKKEAVEWIEENKTLITEMSDRIWLYAEPSFLEYRATKFITDELKKAGFKVELGVAGLDTAFVATYGEGSPVLCTYVECDAVPGISQMPVPYKLPVIPGLAGYYDMHHGIGAGTIGAALAVKHVMEKNNISGTFKVFGTPAEKTSMGKNIMGREGLFENLDACISWHPSDETSADRFISIQIRCNNQTSHTFEGVSVYNAMPWGGYNALHALELMDIAVQFVKDCVVPVSSYPIISSILNKEYADYAVSSIPGVAKATYVSRALTRRENEMIQKRLFDCANGAALALGVTVKNEVLTGTWEPVPNHVLAHAAHKNIEVIGPPKFSEKDFEYGHLVQKAIGLEPSDTPFGDMSIVPPGTRPVRNTMSSTDATTFCYKCPFVMVTTNYLRWGWPDWSTASFSLTNIAHQSFLTAAKIIATTIMDLLRDPKTLIEAKEEFKERTKGIKWYSPIPEDRPVPKLKPFPKKYYRNVVEAFKKGPKWEGWEPELSERMEKISQKVLNELLR
jgi:aminobenzoyl-glutamate utilization protein B